MNGFALFPSGVLTELLVKLDLAGRYRIEIILVVEGTAAAERTVHIVAGYRAGFDGSVLDVGAEDYVGMFACVEEFELVPADKIPVADVVVEHEFAAAQAAYFPYKR